MKRNFQRLLALVLCLALLGSATVFAMMPPDGMGGGMGGDPGMMGGDPGMGGMMGGDPGMMGGMGGGPGGMMSTTTTTSNQAFGNWVFDKVEDSSDDSVTAVISNWIGGDDAVVLLPATVSDGTANYPVTAFGTGNQNIDSNGNKNGKSAPNGNYILFPEAEAAAEIAKVAFYDYNSLAGIVVPGTVTAIGTNAFLSSIPKGAFYGAAGSAIETYAAEQKAGFKTLDGNTRVFTATASEGGWMDPNGTYYLPTAMLDGTYTTQVQVIAHQGYEIDTLTVDGKAVNAAGNEYTFTYTFTTASTGISATFKADPDDSREFNVDYASMYEAPAIVEGAVAQGATLPADVNDYCGVSDQADYLDALNLSSGIYYAANGKVYKTVAVYESTETAQFFSKAEVINYAYSQDAAIAGNLENNYQTKDGPLVYGQDYDCLRLYNFYSYLRSGPSSGESVLYIAFLYKEMTADEVAAINGSTLWNGKYAPSSVYSGPAGITGDYTNTSSVFTQAGGELEISDFTTASYVGYTGGPSEAGNFFGYGAQILIDGGDAATGSYHHTYINYAADVEAGHTTSLLTLHNPVILGNANDMYATGNGLAVVNGGDFFSCGSGSRGAYVSLQGQILLNATDNEGNTVLEVLEDGKTYPIVDEEKLTATAIPEADLVTMIATDKDPAGNAIESTMRGGQFGEHDTDVSLIVSGDEASSAIATDSGGGVIVANQVVCKSYGLRSAGVYTIGANESWVYCYNSNLISYRDGGLVSATGGYAYAYNCKIYGVMGLKTRAGGNASQRWSGIEVDNCCITSEYDYEELVSSYDVAWPTDMTVDMIETALGGTRTNELTMFVDKANSPYFYTASLYWWFVDRNVMPGFAEGANPGYFSVIYSDGGSVPVTVTASKLVNGNYQLYGENSEWYQSHKDLTPENDDLLAYVKQIVEAYPDASITEAPEYYYSYKPAENLLVAADAGSTLTVNFIDCNAETKWDATGASDDTCELVGDFFCAKDSVSSNPQIKGGPNTLIVNLTNSQWEGRLLRGNEAQGSVTISLSAGSEWTVKGLNRVDSLTVAADSKLNGTIVKYDSKSEENGTVTYENVYVAGADADISEAALSLPFTDVDATADYAEAVAYLYNAGIMNGVSATSFDPDAAVNRAMAVTVLGRVLSWTQSESGVFTDVEAGSWYAGYVDTANALGIIQGYGDGRFGPYDTLSGEHLGLIFDRVANLFGMDATAFGISFEGQTVSRAQLAQALYSLSKVLAG